MDGGRRQGQMGQESGGKGQGEEDWWTGAWRQEVRGRRASMAEDRAKGQGTGTGEPGHEGGVGGRRAGEQEGRTPCLLCRKNQKA